jgi:hypothetical protein
MFKFVPAAAAAVALSFAAVPAAEAATTFTGAVSSVQSNGGDPGLVVQTGNYNSFSLPLELGVVSAPVGLFSIWTNETAINADDWVGKNIFVQLAFTAPDGPWSGGPIGGETFGINGIFVQGGRVEWDAPGVFNFGDGGQVKVSLQNANFNWGLFGTNPGQSYGAVVDAKFELLSLPSVSAVPEPATWAMMITGFGLAGATIRRRRVTFSIA